MGDRVAGNHFGNTVAGEIGRVEHVQRRAAVVQGLTLLHVSQAVDHVERAVVETIGADHDLELRIGIDVEQPQVMNASPGVTAEHIA